MFLSLQFKLELSERFAASEAHIGGRGVGYGKE
jgi:hypothetical protein